MGLQPERFQLLASRAVAAQRRQSGVGVDEHGPEREGEQDRRWHHQRQQDEAAGAPALDPDRLGPGGKQSEELGVEITALVAQHVAELRGQGESAGGSECFSDLGDAEPAQRPLVDEFWIGTQRQAQHHVGEVDGLAPRARAGLDERHVDQQYPSVADEQIGRLDVAVGQPAVPQLADQGQPVIDDLHVDDGVAEFGRLIEELGDQQVLPLGGELDEAVGPRCR